MKCVFMMGLCWEPDSTQILLEDWEAHTSELLSFSRGKGAKVSIRWFPSLIA